jgi:beta-1,4-mannosyl-glycoprotein beta-1,4-N-acetylglucosaminyltransferase
MGLEKKILGMLAVTAAVVCVLNSAVTIHRRTQLFNGSVKYRVRPENNTPPVLPPVVETQLSLTHQVQNVSEYGTTRRCGHAESFVVTQHQSDIIAMVSAKNNNPLQKRAIPRKLVFGMTFDCEEWLLEIKLNELGDVVDHFIIVEGAFTFQNTRRDQCFPDIMASNQRISRWRDKIVYVYDTESIQDFEYWEAEVHYRNMIGVKGLAQINTTDDDLVIVTDVDELPHPNFLWVLKWYNGFQTAIRLSMLWSYYSFKWINPNPWTLKAILSVRELKLVQNQTNRIRFDLAGQAGWDTADTLVGWHCSWCLPTRVFMDKMAHFAHSELNQAQFRNVEWLHSMRDQGLWFPDARPNGCIQSRLQIPEYVQKNLQNFEQIWK